MAGIEPQIAMWRSYLLERPALDEADVEELEGHLRDQITELETSGLGDEEAFLVAIRRLGSLDEVSREFAREHSERLWKQLVVSGHQSSLSASDARRDVTGTLGLAVLAALLVVFPRLFGGFDIEDQAFVLNVGFLVLPALAAFFVWRRRPPVSVIVPIGLGFILLAAVVNLYPFDDGGSTEVLAALHLPFVLWTLVGAAYIGGEWRSHARRMDFVRFTGEWLVYFVLIGLGGGLLMGLAAGIFSAIGIDIGEFIGEWILPAGAAGAVVVAAWLVEAKQSVIENMAPVLTQVFTPLLTLMAIVSLIAVVWSGGVLDVEREILIIFDLLLILVAGLLLYSASARNPGATPSLNDWMQLVMVGSALILDLFALAAMADRIVEFGWSPNKAAALGLNLLLAIGLTRSAWLTAGFVRGGAPNADIETWQVRWLPVYAIWAAAVAVGFPPLFSFM